MARPVTLFFGLLLAGTSLVLSACDDGIDPRIWGNFPDSVELYSLARGEYVDRPGAYSILPDGTKGAVTVERLSLNPFGFDFAVTEDEAGTFLLIPTGAFPDARVRPGILVDSTATFEGLERAPRDGYITDAAVVADTGVVYVLRSRPDTRSGCLYYGKMEVLDLDPAGIATLRILANVNCADRSLVPNAPEEEDDEETGDGG